MKAELHSVSSQRGVYDESITVHMEMRVSDCRDMFPMVGSDVYIYPKSRWNMFLDWLLKA